MLSCISKSEHSFNSTLLDSGTPTSSIQYNFLRAHTFRSSGQPSFSVSLPCCSKVGGGSETAVSIWVGSRKWIQIRFFSQLNATPPLSSHHIALHQTLTISSAKREERGRSLNSSCSVTDRVETKGRRGGQADAARFLLNPGLCVRFSLCWPPADRSVKPGSSPIIVVDSRAQFAGANVVNEAVWGALDRYSIPKGGVELVSSLSRWGR